MLQERVAGAQPLLKSQPATTAAAPSTAAHPAAAAAPALVCSRRIISIIIGCYISQAVLTLLHGRESLKLKPALLSRYGSAHQYLRPASSSLLPLSHSPSQSLQLQPRSLHQRLPARRWRLQKSARLWENSSLPTGVQRLPRQRPQSPRLMTVLAPTPPRYTPDGD
jgi:hypothetical protein